MPGGDLDREDNAGACAGRISSPCARHFLLPESTTCILRLCPIQPHVRLHRDAWCPGRCWRATSHAAPTTRHEFMFMLPSAIYRPQAGDNSGNIQISNLMLQQVHDGAATSLPATQKTCRTLRH